MHRIIRTLIGAALIAALMFLNCFAFSQSETISTMFSENVEQELFDLSGLSDYVDPDTPAFDESADEICFTGVSARNAYITYLCSGNAFYKSYHLDPSHGKYPVVFITKEDISACDNYESAADELNKSKRANVFIQAGIHGNEPGGAEGALYFLQRFSANADMGSYLDAMNIVIIPCANVTGTRAGDTQKDANRDNLYAASPYTVMSHNLYNHLMPDVFVDCHEKTYRQEDADPFSDLSVSGAGTSNIDPEIMNLSGRLARAARSRAEECGLRTTDYRSTGNNTMSRNYYALYGSCSVLLETPGINIGKIHFARRVFAHYEGLMGILKYVRSDAGVIRNAVRKGRLSTVARGKKYNKSNRFALKTAKAATGETIMYDLYDPETAELKGTEILTLYARTKTLRSRALPTAYIISKKDPGAKKAVGILKKNGIRYYSIRPGRKVICSKYYGPVTKAAVKKKKRYVFSKGAYVIPMDQPGGRVIAAMMEPDVNDTKGFNGSLVQSKVIRMRSIFRYTGSKKI